MVARSGHYHVRYKQEITILRTANRKIWAAIGLVFVLVLPLGLGNYWLNTLNFALIAVIGALGLNILTGYTGLINLGQGAFLAIGAYLSAVFSGYGLPFYLVLPLAAVITMALGLLVGLPSLRLEGLYLAVVTFAFHFIVLYVITHLPGITGGHNGIAISRPLIGSWEVNTQLEFYYLILPFAVLLTVVASNITFRSRVGRAFVAIRDRDLAAATIGINLTKYKVISFGISSFYAGVAGSLYAYLVNFVTPDHFGIDVSIQYVAMLIAGGIGTVPGAIFGALFISILPEGLRMAVNFFSDLIPSLNAMLALIRQSVYGLIIILFLLFEPKGLYGIWQKIRESWDTYPYKYL